MTATLRVVVVDDEPSVAKLHVRFLTAHPACEVVASVGTGPDAVAAIRQHRPDLVLLDLHLPGFSGIEVLRTVRAAAGPQPEFIAVTAARDFGSVRDARLAGVRHYLVKPFSAKDLHDRVAEIARELAEASDAGALDQGRIDDLIRCGAKPLPKGLSAETLRSVRTALAAAPWSSASELGERVGLSRVSCRRYLEHLVTTGVAERRLDYATSGRPGTRFAARE
ncbi:response regulator [Microbacterium sp. CJ88]|uniref:response regulator n=1 Tax=Microbacterium sp. CJ88 TaxID=3445672 RepID=UPI003F65DCDF